MTRKMARNIRLCNGCTLISFISAECIPEKFIFQPEEFPENTPFVTQHKYNLIQVTPITVQ